MMIATASPQTDTRRTAFEFDSLDALPCGCVAARFRVLPWHGHIIRLEAKGPYCPFDLHLANSIVGIGIRSDMLESDEDV